MLSLYNLNILDTFSLGFDFALILPYLHSYFAINFMLILLGMILDVAIGQDASISMVCTYHNSKSTS